MKTRIISIIGSREPPDEALDTIEKIAAFFAQKGYVLRSGGSTGCDEAGYKGFDRVNGTMEIYLPWQGFNDKRGILWSQENWDAAKEYVPHWDTLKLNHRIFHARNVAIMLGLENNVKSDILVCWTEGGEEIGGSATALRYARLNKIPIYNLGSKTGLTKLRKFCKTLK